MDSPRADGDRVPLAVALDTFTIVLFVAIGRRNHDEDPAASGLIATAAPFLIGLAVAWIVTRSWKRPTEVRTGLMIWPIVVIVGMLVRRLAFDDGTALAFVIVATVFLGLFLIGWRALYRVIASRVR